MRIALLPIAFAAGAALAQVAVPPPQAAPCAECGVVRTVRGITKEVAAPPSEAVKGSGLVASVPLSGGKATVGSSTRSGRDAPTVIHTWEVVVLMDDGRFRLSMFDSLPDLRQGDKVRFEDGKPVLRDR